MTGRSGERRRNPNKRSHGSRGRSRRTILMILLTVIVIVSVTGSGLYLIQRVSGSEPGIGTIGLDVKGREVRVTVGLEPPKMVRIKEASLVLEGLDEDYPLVYRDGNVETVIGTEDMAGLIRSGQAVISGTVEARISPLPVDIKKAVDRTVDLSALKDLNTTAKIGNVSLFAAPIGSIGIKMDFTANLAMDIWIKARNTTGMISTDFGSFEGTILDLELDQEGNGEASFYIPYLAVLPLAFGRNHISIDLWGIPVDFEYPING